MITRKKKIIKKMGKKMIANETGTSFIIDIQTVSHMLALES
jgi:hypothetical protein